MKPDAPVLYDNMLHPGPAQETAASRRTSIASQSGRASHGVTWRSRFQAEADVVIENECLQDRA